MKVLTDLNRLYQVVNAVPRRDVRVLVSLASHIVKHNEVYKSQSEMADLMGVSISLFSGSVRNLKRMGLLHVTRRVITIDPDIAFNGNNTQLWSAKKAWVTKLKHELINEINNKGVKCKCGEELSVDMEQGVSCGGCGATFETHPFIGSWEQIEKYKSSNKWIKHTLDRQEESEGE